MAVPTPKELRDPLLELVSKSENGLTYPQLAEAVAEHFSLSEEDRQQLLPGYRSRTVLVQNLYIVVNHLRKNELLLPADGSKVIRISEQGRGSVGGNGPAIAAAADDLGDTPPEQRLSLAYGEHFETLLEEVLENIRSINPTAFERLVVNLLEEIGYGYGIVTGRSGDRGIDGILTKDRLGLLEKVCVQAKRYNDGNPVGMPDITQFVGSLDDQHTNQGVFITASSFASTITKDSKSGIMTMGSKSIRLIDGRELAELMIRHGVGVVTEITYAVKKLDANYFAEV